LRHTGLSFILVSSGGPYRNPRRFPDFVTLSLFVWLLLPLLALVALVDLATMSPERRAQMLRRAGLTQAAIAQRLGVSRYRVRLLLA
jgi:hypothetical protein